MKKCIFRLKCGGAILFLILMLYFAFQEGGIFIAFILFFAFMFLKPAKFTISESYGSENEIMVFYNDFGSVGDYVSLDFKTITNKLPYTPNFLFHYFVDLYATRPMR